MRVPTSIPWRAGSAQSVIERVASNSLLETYFGVPTHPTAAHTFCLTWKQCSQQFARDVVRRAFTHIRDLKAVFSTSWGRRISACVHTHSYTTSTLVLWYQGSDYWVHSIAVCGNTYSYKCIVLDMTVVVSLFQEMSGSIRENYNLYYWSHQIIDSIWIGHNLYHCCQERRVSIINDQYWYHCCHKSESLVMHLLLLVLAGPCCICLQNQVHYAVHVSLHID